MEPGGWIFMIASWVVILGLFGYAMRRTLRRDTQQVDAPEVPPPTPGEEGKP